MKKVRVVLAVICLIVISPILIILRLLQWITAELSPWITIFRARCDYCGKRPKVWYHAQLLILENWQYKGDVICGDCIKRLI